MSNFHIAAIIGKPIQGHNRRTDSIPYQNSNMGTLGQRLKQCRKDSGYKQAEVCARTGIKQGTLSELENDKYPTSSFVPQLAQLYGVDAMWLATGSGTKAKIKVSDIAMKIAEMVSEMPEDEQAKLLHYLTMKIEMDRQMAMVSQPYEAPAQDRRKSA